MTSTPSFADITTIGVGGSIKDFIEPITRDDFISSIMAADDAERPLCVIGGGSNLLASDQPFDGVVIRDARRQVLLLSSEDDLNENTVLLKADAGVHWDDLVDHCVRNGYQGIEGLSGIPGTVGASVVQNIGAYGQEVASSVVSVEVWDRATSSCSFLSADEMHFGYRTSVLKQSMYATPCVPYSLYFPSPRYIVLSVTFKLQRSTMGTIGYEQLASALHVSMGASLKITEIRRTVLQIRGQKQMLEDPARYRNQWMEYVLSGEPSDDDIQQDRWSCGSFFTNPILTPKQAQRLPQEAPQFPAVLPNGEQGIKTSAAWLIDHAGFYKGYAVDDQAPASLSTVHTLALTNRGHATAHDIVTLAQTIQRGVYDTFGVQLVPEPVIVGLNLGWDTKENK
ncbi:MAG: UDP-N-acetylmuramate dehydrogenase [Aeriscardovia sp.]|nr:UDP-N-acetylmuramate dehydrogenase [Aeriscardovia sp.]